MTAKVRVTYEDPTEPGGLGSHLIEVRRQTHLRRDLSKRAEEEAMRACAEGFWLAGCIFVPPHRVVKARIEYSE